MDRDYLLSRIDYESYYRKHVDGFKPKAGESYGLCFIHDDHKPSLRVNLKDGLWFCPVCNQGGCAIDLHMQKYSITARKAINEIAEEQHISEEPFKLTKVHRYYNAAGKWMHDKQRWDNSYDKKFNYKSAIGDKRESAPILYNLPNVVKAKCVIIVEGEKCADKLSEWGLCGTTLDSGTASDWKQEHLDALKGKNLVLLPDNDDIGKQYMRKLLGKLDNCKFIELPRLLPKGDVADWDGTKEELLELIKITSIWEPPRDYVTLKSQVKRVIDDMLFTDVNTLGIKTGIRSIDDKLGVLRRKTLTVIAGRPSMGKTALMSTMLLNMARRGDAVMLFTPDADIDESVERLLCQVHDTCLQDVTLRLNHEHNTSRIMRAGQELSDIAPVLIDETGGVQVEVLEERLKQAMKDYDLKCVFIDYIQLMNTVTKTQGNEASYIGYITRNLKRIAKECDIPIVMLSQVNRNCENRPNKRPMNSDLKGSGDIEQDANVIILLYRDEFYNPTADNRGMAEALITKCKRGSTGIVNLAFLAESMRFADL